MARRVEALRAELIPRYRRAVRKRIWLLIAAAAIVASIALRIDLAYRFPPEWTWDITHIQYVRYLVEHRDLPREDLDPIGWGNVYYHPPLFYLASAVAGGGEATNSAMKSVNVVAGFVRLALFALALLVLARGRQVMIAFSLALFAILPIASEVDASIANESWSATLALLAVFLSLLAEERGSLKWSALAGVSAGLAFLVKITGALALGTPLIIALLFPSRARFARAVLAGIACVVIASPWLALNLSRYGRPLTKSPLALRSDFADWKAKRSWTEYRPLEWFLLPPTPDLLEAPHYPRAKSFWGALYVWSWGDYEGHLTYRGDHGFGTVQINDKQVCKRGYDAQRRTLWAALLCSAICGIAIAGLFVFAIKRRQPLIAGMLMPIFLYTGFLLVFAWFYPFDHMGMVKSVYLLGAVPLACAAGGIAYAWGWEKFPRARIPIAASVAIPAVFVMLQRIWW